FLERVTIADQDQTQRSRRRFRHRSVGIDQSVNAFVFHHRRNIADGDCIVRPSNLVYQCLIEVLHRADSGFDGDGHYTALVASDTAAGRLDDVVTHHFCKGENMVGQHANVLFRTSSQPICRRGTVHREQSVITIVPPVGGDRPRQPRFLPEAACFVDSRYPVLAPDSSDNERIEEIGLSVKNAWPQASNQRSESLDVLAKPIVQMNFVPPRAGQYMVVDALEGVLTAVVAIRLFDTRLRDDRDAKPVAYLSHSSVLCPEGIASLSYRQCASYYVQNRACR